MIVVDRKELKYAISEKDYYDLDTLFKSVLNQDKNNLKYGYTVRSLYFDSRFDSDFYEKMHGEEVRKKIRLRIYNIEDKFVKLEIKRKINTRQRKETVSISKEDARELIEKNYDVLLKYDNNVAKTIYNIMTVGQYIPVVLIDYNRKAYIHEENSIRVTLDSDIRANETNFDIFSKDIIMTPIFDFYNSILEIKYDGELFCWISSVIDCKDSVFQSFSKYCSARKIFDNYLA